MHPLALSPSEPVSRDRGGWGEQSRKPAFEALASFDVQMLSRSFLELGKFQWHTPPKPSLREHSPNSPKASLTRFLLGCVLGFFLFLFLVFVFVVFVLRGKLVASWARRGLSERTLGFEEDVVFR